jgi:hypothetical protein
MWPSIIAIIALLLSIGSSLLSYFVFVRLSNKLSLSELEPKLQESSAKLSKEYSSQFKSIEIEWENIYAKMMKLAGRMDREKQLTTTPNPTPPESMAITTRSDILRKHRGGAIG